MVLFHCHQSKTYSSPTIGITSVTQCVTVVVLGLFSVDDVVKPDHFVYEQGDKCLNSAKVSGEDELHTYIIRHFSHPNAVIMDITSSQGMYDRL